jgi:DivIVA domain-containing protein
MRVLSRARGIEGEIHARELPTDREKHPHLPKVVCCSLPLVEVEVDAGAGVVGCRRVAPREGATNPEGLLLLSSCLLSHVSIDVSFAVVLRGYDRTEVNAAVRRVNEVLESDDLEARTRVAEDLRKCEFAIRLRGYDRSQVDAYLLHAVSQLA